MALHRVLVPLADGFEEIEAVTIIDTLRRAGIYVVAAGLTREKVYGSHGIAFVADTLLETLEGGSFDAIVLPGGMPGSQHLRENKILQRRIRAQHESGGLIAAICAAPMALASAGVLDGIPATCYPGMEKELPKALFRDQSVVESGQVITGQGVGCALEFSLALVRRLCGDECAETLGAKMLFKQASG